MLLSDAPEAFEVCSDERLIQLTRLGTFHCVLNAQVAFSAVDGRAKRFSQLHFLCSKSRRHAHAEVQLLAVE